MNPTFRILATTIIFILIASFIGYDYYHGGVPTHHLYQRESMPGLSNYWGLVLMPLLTWSLCTYMLKHKPKYGNVVFKEFGSALLFGMAISLFFELNTEVPKYLLMSTFVIATFIPIYRPAYYMGFTWGMCYTFGGVIPVFVGGVLTIIYFIIHKIVKAIKNYFSKQA